MNLEIDSCNKFTEKFTKFHGEANNMFNELTEDFKEVQEHLKDEAKKYGEDEDTEPIEFVDHIYKFGKDFNSAIKHMVSLGILYLTVCNFLGKTRENEKEKGKTW